jgi:hypothetical protein
MKDHMEEVTLVVRKEFGVPQNAITRMTIGSGNEVYLVSLEDRDVIVRLNESDEDLKSTFRCTDQRVSKCLRYWLRTTQKA